MNQLVKSNRSLVVLNAALLAGLVLVMWSQTAGAQNSAERPANGRNRGEYTMISGKTNAGGADAIYVLDAANQEVIALRWDVAKQSLTGIGYRNLIADSKSVPGR
jgi:hypothetical protein